MQQSWCFHRFEVSVLWIVSHIPSCQHHVHSITRQWSISNRSYEFVHWFNFRLQIYIKSTTKYYSSSHNTSRSAEHQIMPCRLRKVLLADSLHVSSLLLFCFLTSDHWQTQCTYKIRSKKMGNDFHPHGQLLPYCFLFASVTIVIAAWPPICCIIFIKHIE